jgi:tetratricopeptide (TPR) repeat protein
VRNIERLTSLSNTEREDETAFARSLEIVEHWNSFCQHALPVIASLLPEDADLGTMVYLTAFSEPPYFAYNSNVVMNTDVLSYLGKTSKLFNLLGHELLHIGYFNYQPYQTEVWSDNYPTMVLLTTLQNDGLAVYTQYLLNSIYPAPAEIELLLLDSQLVVDWLMDRVNTLLQDAEKLPEAEIMSEVFEGLNQRALYVVGAHMAKTIDEHLGREALAQTVAEGPRAFIRTYNTVAEVGQELHEIPEPTDLSPIQVLRQAALQGDLDAVEVAIDVIEATEIENPGGAFFEHLMSAGLLLLEEDQASLAVEVFRIMVDLFPDHPYGYLNLGDAYRQMGDLSEADAAYQQVLEIDPRLEAVIDR